MTATEANFEPSLSLTEEIRVRASLETTFAALLEQLGPGNTTPDGTPLVLKIEAWPGGRWYRDLGDGNGHFWATVQAIKRPGLLEFSGPLMMSAPVVNNIQYRLSHEKGVTVIQFRHVAFGPLPEGFGDRMPQGWAFIHNQAKLRAEKMEKAQ